MHRIILFFILIISALINAQEQNEQLSTIDSIVHSKLAEDDPGLFVGIVKNGKIIYEFYRGLASLQHQVKIDKNSVSNIASVAKQFTALMVLDLSLKGKLDLDDDFRMFLPEFFPSVKDTIKVRHLINHTSGIRDYYDLMSIQQNPWWRREGLDNQTALELLQKQKDLAFKPGSKYLYSNSGYTILAKIIEVVSNENFHSYSKTFFENLGMNSTSFLKDYMEVIPNQALPYSDWGDGVWKQYPMITNLYGDGFLFTTLQDQLIYEKALQNAGKNDNQLLLHSQNPITNSKISTYGFGLELTDWSGHKAVHHAGGTGSYHSQVVRFPEEQLSVFIMSNNSNLWSGGIANEVAKVFLSKKIEEENYNVSMQDIPKELLENHVLGFYLTPDNYIVKISGTKEILTWQHRSNNPTSLTYEEGNRYSFTNNPKVKIGFFEDSMELFYPSGKMEAYIKLKQEALEYADFEQLGGRYESDELNTGFYISLENKAINIQLDGWDSARSLQALNRNTLILNDYIFEAERDAFDRVIAIALTYSRAMRNSFKKVTNLKFQPIIATINGSIQVTTVGSKKGDASDILLTKNDTDGNEIWFKQFGGKSYDKANSILETKDGYLIIGSTSSFGNGNYDILVIKTDKDGNTIWQNTYGDFYNEYGYSAEKVDAGYLIKGTKQACENNTDINRKCSTNVWFVSIDDGGKQISESILEELENADY